MNLPRPKGRGEGAVADVARLRYTYVMDKLLDRIGIDPEICGGKPCIRGTRIWVSLILDLLAARTPEEEILAEYPHLTSDDLRAAIATVRA